MTRWWRVALLHAALALLAGATLLPFLWMVTASISPTGEALQGVGSFVPSRVTLEHFRALFTRLALGRTFLNSLLIASAATAVSLFLNSMAGYAFAKLRFPGRDRLHAILLAALVIPAQVGMLPLFLMVKGMGLTNSYLGVILPSLTSIFGIVLIRQYALSIPDSLLDAARIDGASELRIYRSLILVWCRPILVTLGVFTFLGVWSDFFWPLVVLSDESRYTLPVALANLMGEHAQDSELMMAGAVVTLLPVLLIFIVLQRYYVAGIMGGALKG
jgi:multiple sugar transport system permease protein